jgi:N utilization substance protein B
VPPYAIDLVEGVVAHRREIDQLISSLAEGWTLARMPAVDRNVLRLGAFELLYRADVPPGVAVSEAVDLAGRLSTDESAAFVNGVLARVAERRPAGAEGSDGFDSAPRVG